MCVKLNLETFTGTKKSQIENHEKYMGINSNCRVLEKEERFIWKRPNEANITLKVLPIESPHK